MKETPVYEEWKVHSVNSKKIVARLAGLIEEVKQAKDAPSCIKAMKAYGRYCDKIGDNFATISLKYTLDTRDKTNIKNEEAIDIARQYGAEIQYDEASATPYFYYYENGRAHVVWFEDARSWTAKLALIPEYGFLGAGIWNAMRPFTAGWLVLQSGYRVTAFLE